MTAHSTSDVYKIDHLFNETNLRSYFHYLKYTYKPTTTAEKLRRVTLAVKYTMESKENYISRGNSVLTLLTNWLYSLSEAVAIQRKRHYSQCVQDETLSDKTKMPHMVKLLYCMIMYMQPSMFSAFMSCLRRMMDNSQVQVIMTPSTFSKW